VLEALHDWLHQTRLRTAPNTGAAKAIDYALKRWPALVRYAETGDLPIDNNPVENSIRPIALGKNYAQFVIMRSSLSVSRKVA
jgi:transposase